MTDRGALSGLVVYLDITLDPVLSCYTQLSMCSFTCEYLIIHEQKMIYSQ
jgi:hypothetical protein